MLPDYSDIISRLGEPLWWDDRGVPRYEPFHPDMCDVYARYIAFLRIICQACGREFRVASSIDVVDLAQWNRPKDEIFPGPNSLGGFYYGDPPRHDCVGDTMGSIPRQVLEFWQRTKACRWERVPQYETEIYEDWGGDGYD